MPVFLLKTIELLLVFPDFGCFPDLWFETRFCRISGKKLLKY